MPAPPAAKSTLPLVKKARRRLAALPLADRRCVFCENRVSRFLPYEGGWDAAPALMVALEWIGSDLDHFECPSCGAHDRERHLFLYMRQLGLLAEISGKNVVHFAPEHHLSRVIADHGPASYVKCDLFPTASDIVGQDLLAMSFESASVDLFIANHVLEHVDDDRRAVSEICRVLRPGGRAILQTPFSPVLQRTWEDHGIVTPEARLQAYGQADHVRLYGADFIDRIASFGLRPLVREHHEVLPEVSPHKAGVNAREPFLLFERE
jgi:hypothetical protein